MNLNLAWISIFTLGNVAYTFLSNVFLKDSKLSKREQIAAIALQGLIRDGYMATDDAVKTSVIYADKLIKELKNKK